MRKIKEGVTIIAIMTMCAAIIITFGNGYKLYEQDRIIYIEPETECNVQQNVETKVKVELNNPVQPMEEKQDTISVDTDNEKREKLEASINQLAEDASFANEE